MLTATAAYQEQEALDLGARPAVVASVRRAEGEAWQELADVEVAGSISLEAPEDFSGLVCGQVDGLTLSNRQGSVVDGAWVPAPLYSPNKSSFIFAGEDWYKAQIKLELGWDAGGFFRRQGFLSAPFLARDIIDPVQLFHGEITEWGPVTRGVEQDGKLMPATVEITVRDWIYACLQKRVGLPAADGTPQPLTYGEFLCPGEKIVGWTPEDPLKTADFEDGTTDELDAVVESGGGDVSVITPGLAQSTYALRGATSGASQAAAGILQLDAPAGELFIAGLMRFTTVPGTPVTDNCHFLEVLNGSDTVIFKAMVKNDGLVRTQIGSLDIEESSFNIGPYVDVPITWAFWFHKASPGCCKLWMAGEEVLSYDGELVTLDPVKVKCGPVVGATAETWSIDFDALELGDTYYDDAYQVHGGPFAGGIGSVYSENVVQPSHKLVYTSEADAFDQYVYRYPTPGIVQFAGLITGNKSKAFRCPTNVMIRVAKQSPAGPMHALAIIEDLLDRAGLTDYIDAAALAAAYAAVPDDYINARFEGGKKERLGLTDYSQLGVTIGDCIKEICARMLYWFLADGDKIKIIPYAGGSPEAETPALALDGGNLREAAQRYELEQVNDYVCARYGWYERNPSLFYINGVPAAGGSGLELDFTWGSPVACENPELVRAKVDLLKIFMSAKDRIDPARLNLAGARLELMQDVVSLDDAVLNDAAENYWVQKKEIALEPQNNQVTLQLQRVMGEL